MLLSCVGSVSWRGKLASLFGSYQCVEERCELSCVGSVSWVGKLASLFGSCQCVGDR